MSEQNTQREAAVQQQQAVAQSRNLNAELQILAKFGGFNVLESSVDGIQNMNPERKARRNIFLSDPERAAERKELEKRLEMWVDMLKGNKSISEMVELCQKKSAAVSGLLSQNQLKAVEEVRQLEKSYRTVMLFYKNTDSDKIKNISIVNASMSQLTDLDNSFFMMPLLTSFVRIMTVWTCVPTIPCWLSRDIWVPTRLLKNGQRLRMTTR